MLILRNFMIHNFFLNYVIYYLIGSIKNSWKFNMTTLPKAVDTLKETNQIYYDVLSSFSFKEAKSCENLAEALQR